MKMATETVAAFSSKFSIDDHKNFSNIELKEQGLEYINGYQSGVKRYGMPLDELGATKDRDFPMRMKRSKETESDSSVCKENENTTVNGTNKMNGEMKKKRNTRKRNRSDMSPEELRRLRERERKAQQSRRDRIRAQKRQNQAWHDDDAAWEAFLDQTDVKQGTKGNKKHNSSSVPSMVCSIESTEGKQQMVNGSKEPSEIEEPQLENQISHETESNTGSNHSAEYSSDDSNQDDSSKDSSKKAKMLSDAESHQEETTIISTKSEKSETKEKDEPLSKQHYSEIEPMHHSHEEKRHHHPYYLSSPPPKEHHPFNHKLSPHSHHTRDYYPSLYAPDPSHHQAHYSPPDGKHYLPSIKHHHDSHLHHHHHDSYDKKSHHKHYYPSHFIPIIHSQPSSPNRDSKPKNSASPHCEKKKMISRNVDRKKLSEEELEELRRRERDYQRERRARIRMEKAKTQAQQERFHKNRDLLPGYYHPADLYRHVRHPHDRHMDVVSRYDHPEHHRRRESPPKYSHKSKPDGHQHSEQLQVNIPESDLLNNSTEKADSDLLQVVPKTREYEDKHIPPTATSSPVEDEPKPKKSLLESICSSLKKDSIEWAEKDDKLVIDLKKEDKASPKENSKDSMDSEENLAKLKEELISKDFYSLQSQSEQSEDQKLRDKMTEDQLERRRRSNREAQRRRRARLKMQGHVDDRHDFEHHIEDMEKEKDIYELRKGQVKARPDTLYMPNFHEVYPRRGSYHKDRLHEQIYLHEKYGHRLPPDHYAYRNKHIPYYRPVHHGIEMDDSPRHPHYLYEPLRSPDYHHEHAVHHHVSRRHDKVDRDYGRSPPQNGYEDNRKPSHSVEPEKDKTPSSETENSRHNSESRDDLTNENETATKSGGRKRKQCAPRKLASSANTTPDEEINSTAESQVVILNGFEGQHVDNDNIDDIGEEEQENR